MTQAATPARLMLITPELSAGELAAPLVRALSGLRCGGRVIVQLRAKEASGRALYEAGKALRAATRAAEALLLVNGRVDVALALEADGVHLPEGGLDVPRVRALGPWALVGRACHDAAGLERAAAEGADYALLSPIAVVPGKGAPLGLAGFRVLTSAAALPVFALGGVGLDDVAPLIASGAAGVAILRGVALADDPALALRRYLRALDDAPQPPA